MLGRLRPRLTYGNVTATLALLLAVGGGTVYAVEKIGSSEIAKNAIKSKHVKKDALKGTDINEAKLGQVPSATTAGSADSAHPVAFAHVIADGSVDTSRSKGIGPANVDFDNSSTYCFTNLPFDPRGAQVTDDYTGGHNDTGLQLGLEPTVECPEPATQAFVYTFKHVTGAAQPANFYVAFYR